MKTYHFYVGKDHLLFKAKTYNNALKRAKKENEVVTYIGWSNGVFGEIYFNKR